MYLYTDFSYLFEITGDQGRIWRKTQSLAHGVRSQEKEIWGGQEENLLEPKRGEVSHQISSSGGEMGQKDRGNELQAPVWIY